jgi:ABC-type multidrug transport system permease subunit
VHFLQREAKLTLRDTAFLKGRVMQSLLVGAIAGSLFSDLPTEDSNTMAGILFFAGLFGALAALPMIPIMFAQRAVFYKHSRALFFPTPAYVLAQTVVMYPLQMLETLAFTTIIYWSVGLSDDNSGGRYFTFMLACLVFSLCVSQYFRLVASVMAVPTIAQTVAGVSLVLMVLFCGFIIPKNNIPPGWIWFYWINPLAYVLKSVTVNEFLASDYDSTVCLSADCTASQRFGDLVLESRGNPTEHVWVWYGVAVLVALYLFFLVLTTVTLSYLRLEPKPPPPIAVLPYQDAEECAAQMTEIPFEPVSFAFKDICYTVKVGKNEELDLLKGVSGYFEPGTVTALVRLTGFHFLVRSKSIRYINFLYVQMGSSGAGKTTR